MQEISSVPTHCPSFSSYSSVRFAEIATKVTEEFSYESDEFGFEDSMFTKETTIHKQSLSNDDDFEFAFDSRDPNTSLSISADEIFSNGRIRPIFPVFNRDLLLNDDRQVQEINNSIKPTKSSSRRLPLGKLFIKERDSSSSSSSSSEAEDLESIPCRSYCIWTPKSVPSSPDTCKKSYSSGNNTKRFWLKDLIHRSNSDGNEAYVLLAPPPPPELKSSSSKSTKKKSRNNIEKAEKVEVSSIMERKNSINAVKNDVKVLNKGTKKVISESVVSSHEIHYLRNRALKEGDRRRSYLPYKRDLIGFFTNVNGLNRKLYPFLTA